MIIMYLEKVESMAMEAFFEQLKRSLDLIVTQRSDLDANGEIIWTQCQLASKNGKCLLFCSYYGPQVHDVASLHELVKSLLSLGNKLLRHNVIVAGDFNAPNIDSENQKIAGNVFSLELLLEIIDKHDLSQLGGNQHEYSFKLKIFWILFSLKTLLVILKYYPALVTMK